MGLSDIRNLFFPEPTTADDDIITFGVGDLVTATLPSGRCIHGVVAQTDVTNQLAKVAYLFDNRLSFMWVPPDTMDMRQASH